MGSEGRDTLRVLERIATSLEKLAEDPVIEIESGPVVCPHCDTVNPEVKTEDSAGQGPLIEFLLGAVCLNCKEIFYAVPLQWAMFTNLSEAEKEINERAGVLEDVNSQ